MTIISQEIKQKCIEKINKFIVYEKIIFPGPYFCLTKGKKENKNYISLYDHSSYYDKFIIAFEKVFSDYTKEINSFLIILENNLVVDIKTADLDITVNFKENIFVELDPEIKNLVEKTCCTFFSGKYSVSETEKNNILKLILSLCFTLSIKEAFDIFSHMIYYTSEKYNIDTSNILDSIYEPLPYAYGTMLSDFCNLNKNKHKCFYQDILYYCFENWFLTNNLDIPSIYVNTMDIFNIKINKEKTLSKCYSMLNSIKEAESHINVPQINKTTIDCGSEIYETDENCEQVQIFFCDENSPKGGSTKRTQMVSKMIAQKNRYLKGDKNIHQKLELLKADFPNFENAINFIEEEFLLSMTGNNYLYFSPMLLAGEPGIGKTFFTNRLSQTLQIPKHFHNSGTNSAGFTLSGISEMFREGQEGIIIKTLIKEKWANSLFVFDEIDKFSKSNQYPIEPVYLSLLESHTAKNFIDEYLEFPVDASYLNIIATANDIFQISKPLLSRFNLFEVPLPNKEERIIFSKSIFDTIILSRNIKIDKSSISSEFWNEICKDADSLRDIDKTLKRALVSAIKRNQNNLSVTPEDISNYKTKNSPTIGFINR